MNVTITCTPEFSQIKLEEIVALLNGIPGELNFIKGKPLGPTQYKRLNQKLEEISQIKSLTFAEFFDLIQGYRELREIEDDDFVIVISSIRNNKNWFSAFNQKNIFIHGDEWDMVSNVDSKFGIAYQCVENIFQSLIDLDIDNVNSEPNIHEPAIGCINDFCGNKPDILKKFQTANICDSCYQRAINKGINDFILAHIISILEEIRKEFVISKRIQSQTKLEKVRVDENGNIHIGDRMIKLETLPKVMYIGFLKQIEGIPTNKLCDKKEQFDGIYRVLRPNPNDEAISKMCCSKIEVKGNIVGRSKTTFETYRSKIRMALRAKLGDIVSNFYAINLIINPNDQNIFKVPLSDGQYEVHPKFKK
jgi:hypothetical protein